MKSKISLFVLCLFAGIISVQAQGQGGGQRRTVEERVKMVMDKVTPALKLEAAQVAPTDSAFAGYYRGMEKLRATMQPGTRPDRSVFEGLTTERDAQLKKVFTADQFKKFKDEVEATLRGNRGGGGNGGGGNGGGNR